MVHQGEMFHTGPLNENLGTYGTVQRGNVILLVLSGSHCELQLCPFQNPKL